MEENSKLSVLITQYEIVQKQQSDSNSRIFQIWIGFGAIVTATGVFLITGQQQLIVYAPLAYILWFYLLGMMSYDNQYRAVFLAYQEQEINQLFKTKVPLLMYESFASARFWKIGLKSPYGIQVGFLYVYLANFFTLLLYFGVCYYAVRSLKDESVVMAAIIIYSFPIILYIIISTIIAPRQLRKFSQDIREIKKLRETETLVD